MSINENQHIVLCEDTLMEITKYLGIKDKYSLLTTCNTLLKWFQNRNMWELLFGYKINNSLLKPVDWIINHFDRKNCMKKTIEMMNQMKDETYYFCFEYTGDNRINHCFKDIPEVCKFLEDYKDPVYSNVIDSYGKDYICESRTSILFKHELLDNYQIELCAPDEINILNIFIKSINLVVILFELLKIGIIFGDDA